MLKLGACQEISQITKELYWKRTKKGNGCYFLSWIYFRQRVSAQFQRTCCLLLFQTKIARAQNRRIKHSKSTLMCAPFMCWELSLCAHFLFVNNKKKLFNENLCSQKVCTLVFRRFICLFWSFRATFYRFACISELH